MAGEGGGGGDAAGAGMPDGIMQDPFTAALRQPDLLQRLAAFPDVQKHMADPGFMKELEKLKALADSPAATSGDIMKSAEVGQQIARAGHKDPRIMQALLALQGQGLVVEEKDLKKAEDHGDMKRREPVQLEQLRLVKDIESAEEAKAKGNEYFKAGDLSAALAHYERGVQLLRQSEEVSAALLATLLSNSALMLLKLKWPDRAKKSASQAIAIIRQAEDESFDQSKLFYRRALACEQLKEFDLAADDMARAFQQAKRSELSLAEQHRLKGEVERLKKLKSSADTDAEKKRQEKENEKVAEVQRLQGAQLEAKSNAKATSSVSVPSSDYIAEQDFTHWTRKRVEEAVIGIRHSCQRGGTIEVKELQEQSKVQASITTKRGTRALYYEMDLHCVWKAKVKEGEMQGLIRLYNIAHDTSFQLGGDENTSYMYQLGWDHRQTGDWVEEVRKEAAELFDLVSAKVDEVITELRKK
mmetsp:Transcript_112769/g.291498  ORF Transcript_112769/g.291498 Transcript_112769/m.291498 type:complete len:471 (+) Transcript_112769:64-1476(+)